MHTGHHTIIRKICIIAYVETTCYTGLDYSIKRISWSLLMSLDGYDNTGSKVA